VPGMVTCTIALALRSLVPKALVPCMVTCTIALALNMVVCTKDALVPSMVTISWSVRLLWVASRTVYIIWPVWPLAKSEMRLLVIYQRKSLT